MPVQVAGRLYSTEVCARIAEALPKADTGQVGMIVYSVHQYSEGLHWYAVADRRAVQARLKRVSAAAEELRAALSGLVLKAVSPDEAQPPEEVADRAAGDWLRDRIAMRLRRGAHPADERACKTAHSLALDPAALRVLAAAAGAYRPRGRKPRDAERELLFLLARVYEGGGGTVALSGGEASPGPFERFVRACLELLPEQHPLRLRYDRPLRDVVDRFRAERRGENVH